MRSLLASDLQTADVALRFERESTTSLKGVLETFHRKANFGSSILFHTSAICSNEEGCSLLCKVVEIRVRRGCLPIVPAQIRHR